MKPDSLSKLGLVPNHSYSIIKCIHFATKKEGEVRLLKLHNPWGSIEWTGAWGNKDKRWTKDLLKQIGSSVSTPGCFHIPFDSFLKYFKITTITENELDYEYNSLRLTDHKKYAVVEVCLKTNSHLYLSVSQVNPRLLKTKYKSCLPST